MPFTETTTGARLYYDDLGDPDGEPVLVLHGWLGTARFDMGETMDWLVSLGYRVIGPTRRGYGESEPKPRRYPVDFYDQDARDMLAFMDAIALPHAHLMGYSDGGETALIMAGTQPERFASVTVWGAVGYFGEKMRAAAQNAYPATWMTDEDKARNGIRDGDAYVLSWIHAVRQIIDAGGDVSLHLAPAITAPLLLLLGETDTLNPREYGQRLVDEAVQSPDARVLMFPCGHPVHRDAEGAFRQVVGDLLKRYPVAQQPGTPEA